MGAQAYERYWGDPQDSARHTNDLLSAYRAMMPGHDTPPDDRERSDAALLGAA
jgi:hypothetical protein